LGGSWDHTGDPRQSYTKSKMADGSHIEIGREAISIATIRCINTKFGRLKDWPWKLRESSLVALQIMQDGGQRRFEPAFCQITLDLFMMVNAVVSLTCIG